VTAVPSVSIITVCRNAAASIDACLRSIIWQTYKNIEYIVIDGRSTDKTLEIVNKYRDRIAILVSEPDDGIYSAMNKGLTRASGDFILFINADDHLVDRRAIADVIQFISRYPMGDVYYGSIEVRLQDGSKTVYHPEPPDMAAEVMVCGSLPHQATFARRQVFAHTGPFNEDYRIHADYDWFLKVIADPSLTLVRVDRVVASFRLGGTSSQLATGQPEVYRIQNASPLYRSEEWSHRRIAILQENLLAARLENERLRMELSAGKTGNAVATVLAVADRFLPAAITRMLKSLKRSLIKNGRHIGPSDG
jgi:glycosyltransferase involved in cell wall biosynthesis